jgi:hypothetical protein
MDARVCKIKSPHKFSIFFVFWLYPKLVTLAGGSNFSRARRALKARNHSDLFIGEKA